jgi:hypothetical protein
MMTDIEAQKGRFHDPARLDGFPSFAHFISEDIEGAIFRKFDRLSARNLLYLQSNLNELRAALDNLDKLDAERGLRDTRIRLSAKAYSDMKAKAKRYQDGIEAAQRRGEETTAVHSEENTIGADAFERIELHKQIKEAMRDYRKSSPAQCGLFRSC